MSWRESAADVLKQCKAKLSSYNTEAFVEKTAKQDEVELW